MYVNNIQQEYGANSYWWHLMAVAPNTNRESIRSSTRHSQKRKRYCIGDKYPGKYLTKRELECVYYMVRGNTGKSIARILNLSARTVESYIENIKSKFGCNTRSKLIGIIFESGLLSQINFIE